MKITKKIIQFILITVLTVCAVALALFTILSSTILDKKYVEQELQKTNFYTETYKLVESNFKKYIYQSGLDESVLNGIATEEQVKDDIKLVLSNIYNGTNKKVDTTSLENKLNENIDALDIKDKNNEGAINDFVKLIADEYKNTIIHTNLENQIYQEYAKIVLYKNKAKTMLIVVAIIDLIILIGMNLSSKKKILESLGISLLSTGLLDIICCQILNSKVKISNIKVFNDAFSKSLTTILNNIVKQIQTFGIIVIIISLVLIVLYAVINSNKKVNKKVVQN